ncbi:MAG: TetR/AcrR family transcriptional regulator [Marinobacter sp.]
MSRENTETQKKILKATVKSLTDSGGAGVRMSDIAKAAGVSRQAVYLHFASRTELLVAATRFMDEELNLEKRLEFVRSAETAEERLTRYVHFWGEYIPGIYGIAKALMVARHTDEAANAAWDDRMSALKSGCRSVVRGLKEEDKLKSEWTEDTATEAFWSLLLIPVWENLTLKCGWTSELYQSRMTLMVSTNFVK